MRHSWHHYATGFDPQTMMPCVESERCTRNGCRLTRKRGVLPTTRWIYRWPVKRVAPGLNKWHRGPQPKCKGGQ